MASELGKVYVSPDHSTGKFRVMPLKPDGTVNHNVYAQARTLSFNTFEDAVKYAKGLVAHYGGTVESDTRGKSVNSRPGAKDMMGTNKRIIRARGHEFLAEDEGNRTRISIKIDGAWEHATTVNSDNQTAAEWIEANAKPGDPSRWLPSSFSRPGAPDTFAVEDRFYFGKGRKERFGVEDRVDSLIAGAYRALKNGDKSAAKRMIREAEVLASSEPNLPANILNDLKDLKKSMRF